MYSPSTANMIEGWIATDGGVLGSSKPKIALGAWAWYARGSPPYIATGMAERARREGVHRACRGRRHSLGRRGRGHARDVHNGAINRTRAIIAAATGDTERVAEFVTQAEALEQLAELASMHTVRQATHV